MGHSRGTVTALAAAGGSPPPPIGWGFRPEPRVKAIMGLAIGARPITFMANLANVSVPAVLVAGGLDRNSAQVVSEEVRVCAPVVGGTSVCLSTSIPCTGLETEEVKEGVKEIAVAFFDTALKPDGNDGIHFTRYLAPKSLMKHVPMVGSAQAYAGPGSVCPPGQGVICAD
jgi:hypothetical protein